MHGWWSECPHCGGNCDPNETRHVHGGPDRGGSHGPANERSYLSESNGCGMSMGAPDGTEGGEADLTTAQPN